MPLQIDPDHPKEYGHYWWLIQNCDPEVVRVDRRGGKWIYWIPGNNLPQPFVKFPSQRFVKLQEGPPQ